jgi:uncharacterized OsmC-like protein
VASTAYPPAKGEVGLATGVEGALHAMTVCVLDNTVLQATKAGIELQKMEVETTGKLNMLGALHQDPKKRSGFEHVLGVARIESAAPSADVYKAFRLGLTHSPMVTSIATGVPVEFHLDADNDKSKPFADSDNMRNGIDVARWTQGIQSAEKMPIARVGTTTTWTGGMTVKTSCPGWVQGAEPWSETQKKEHFREQPVVIEGGRDVALLGKNAAPSPAETLLQAMANSIMTQVLAIAAKRKIRLSLLEVNPSGQVDVQGMLSVDTTKPIAFKSITVNAKIRGSATAAELSQLFSDAFSHSAVVDSVGKPTPVTFAIYHNGTLVGPPSRKA